MALRALASVNLAAIERNVALLRGRLPAGTRFCAVVKADGYGHGAVEAARAAQAGGATWLAVAAAGEAVILREGGIHGPILVMGALGPEELIVALEAGADIVAWDERFLAAVIRIVSRWPVLSPARIHVKLDTGMGRLGTRLPEQALAVAQAAATADGVQLIGAMTHFATADEDDPSFLHQQLARFEPVAAELRNRAPGLIVHAANSAATLREPASHLDLVRCGIAVYGCHPAGGDPAALGLEPALQLSSYVAAVKPVLPGQSAGYGRRFIAAREGWLATIPIGYGDGVRRALSNNCDVLIGGRRYPLVGTVSMDNITVALGDDAAVAPGAETILIGRDGGERQTAEQLAARIGTINYEILCGITGRVPRGYHHDGVPASPALRVRPGGELAE
jgi:alanine racemase